MFPRSQNPRTEPTGRQFLTDPSQEREASCRRTIGLRYPIRVYQSGQSSRSPSSVFSTTCRVQKGGPKNVGEHLTRGHFISVQLRRRHQPANANLVSDMHSSIRRPLRRQLQRFVMHHADSFLLEPLYSDYVGYAFHFHLPEWTIRVDDHIWHKIVLIGVSVFILLPDLSI